MIGDIYIRQGLPCKYPAFMNVRDCSLSFVGYLLKREVFRHIMIERGRLDASLLAARMICFCVLASRSVLAVS